MAMVGGNKKDSNLKDARRQVASIQFAVDYETLLTDDPYPSIARMIDEH